MLSGMGKKATTDSQYVHAAIAANKMENAIDQ